MTTAIYRAADADDLGLIYSSWLRSYWDAQPPCLRGVDREAYFSDRGHHGVVERLLAKSDVLVACDADDPQLIFGWACGAPGLLHYVYVKELYRRPPGVVAYALLQRLGLAEGDLRVSHLTRAFAFGIGRRRKYIYDPYTIMECYQ